MVNAPLPSSSSEARKSQCSVSVLRSLCNKYPIQPVKATYPKSIWGGKLRGFQACWYGTYDWLEYIDELDACLCFPCRVFSPKGVSIAYTVDGYKNWKNFMAKVKGFDQHKNSELHGKAMAAWEEFNSLCNKTKFRASGIQKYQFARIFR